MKIRTRIILITTVCIGVILIAIAGLFINALFGNPISYLMAKSAAEKHLAANYASTDYVIKDVLYDLKDTDYIVHVESPALLDGNFALRVTMLGKVYDNDYHYRVTMKANLTNRLMMEYRENVRNVLESAAFPYTTDICFGDLEFSTEGDTTPPPGMITTADIENHRIYDVNAIGATNGEIVLTVADTAVTYEKAAEILLTCKRLLDDAGIRFYKIDFELMLPRGEDGLRRGDSINCREIFASEIYEEGLVDRIIAAEAQTDAYYAEKDGEK